MSWKLDSSKTVKIIRKLTEKLQERSPLKYSIVRNPAPLSSVKMVQKKEECSLKLKRLVERLCEMKWISAVDGDDSKLQYEEFSKSANGEYKHYFLRYCKKNNCLDKLLALYIDGKKCDKLWHICKPKFALSHGQTAFEIGFSVNKKILGDNLQQKSLISQRMVHGYMTMKHDGSLHEYLAFSMPNSLIVKCKSSHAKCVQFLEEQKKASENVETSKKRSLILHGISEVKKKKRI